MSEQESERTVPEADADTEDVEGHIIRREEGAPREGEAGAHRENDDPDVEGHIQR